VVLPQPNVEEKMKISLNKDSLKNQFVQMLESDILSGRLAVGDKILPERELSIEMGMSRTIIHSGMVELTSKGLVSVNPRKGCVVNDYRREGTAAVLDSLMKHKEEAMDKNLLRSILDTRFLIEVECIRLAVKNNQKDNIDSISEIIEAEKSVAFNNVEQIIALDFNFHHLIALASGNIFYPLIIKSFEVTYKNYTQIFFKDESVIPYVFDIHAQILLAFLNKDEKRSVELMQTLLTHGEKHLLEYINK
jgi:DNA-binding FadR family transcriptional regulator